MSIDQIAENLSNFKGYWDSSYLIAVWQLAGYYDDINWTRSVNVINPSIFGRSTPARMYDDYWSREQHMVMALGIYTDLSLIIGEPIFYVGFGKDDVRLPFDEALKVGYVYPDIQGVITTPDSDGLLYPWVRPHIGMYFHYDFSVYLSVCNGVTQRRYKMPGVDWRDLVSFVADFPTKRIGIAYYPNDKIDCYFDDALVYTLQYDAAVFPSGSIVRDSTMGTSESDIHHCMFFMKGNNHWSGIASKYKVSEYSHYIKSL